METARWTDSVPTLDGFPAIADAAFHPVPEDWRVLVADVSGSTRAIAEGRYKDVNTLGAACIVAAQNAADGEEVPSVFGGDGATLLVAPAVHDEVEAALRGVARIASEMFGLRLRVGGVGVGELAARGGSVGALRYRLPGGTSLWALRGSGLAMAEALVKRGSVDDGARDAVKSDAQLEGLSCRWDAIPARHGSIVTIIVEPADPRGELGPLLWAIDAVVGGEHACPVDPQRMRYRGLREILRDEWRYASRRATPAMAWRIAEILVAYTVFRLHIPLLPSAHYIAGLPAHSDFRKFDGALRMVLDLSPAQRDALQALLRREAEAGHIRFGLHQSPTALMTCLVHGRAGMADGRHVHFIDGGDGGYAIAAMQLKARRDQPRRS